MPHDEYPAYPDLLTDPQAVKDMDGSIERMKSGDADALDHELYNAAVFHRFIEQVDAGGQVERWILNLLARELSFVLAGAMWEERFPLPGRAEVPSALPGKQSRDLGLYCDVANAISAGEKATHAIAAAAVKNHVSGETVRAAYYYWKNRLSKKDGSGLEEN